MIWIVVGVGLVLAVFGATAGGALIALSRAELARVVSRRLRGAAPSMATLGQIVLRVFEMYGLDDGLADLTGKPAAVFCTYKTAVGGMLDKMVAEQEAARSRER